MKDITPSDRAKALVSRLDRKGGMVTVDALALEQMVTEAIQAESNAQLMRGRAADRQSDVAAFHRKFGVPCPEKPGWPSQERIDLRVKLIAEEFCEFLRDCGYEFRVQVALHAYSPIVFSADSFTHGGVSRGNERIHDRDLAAAADALIDMEYVILGTHCEFGTNSTPLWQEVQAANMRKEGSKRGDGKILKGEGWVGPDITGALRRQGWSDGDADTDREMTSDELAAQFASICKPIEEVAELTPTERGDKGFGSTGR